MGSLASKVGRRGTVVLPARLRRRLGIEEGSFVVAEEREDGILIRPATVLPVEIYSPERRAEFLLNNAVGAEDYRHAQAEVKRMGRVPAGLSTFSQPSAAQDRGFRLASTWTESFWTRMSSIQPPTWSVPNYLGCGP